MSIDWDLIFVSLGTAILAATPVLIAATGELFEETVGIYNLGIEGAMLIGALTGLIAANATNSLLLALLAAVLMGALASLVFGVGVVYVHADMVVAGLALVGRLRFADPADAGADVALVVEGAAVDRRIDA